jgi:hypothetical protein
MQLSLREHDSCELTQLAAAETWQIKQHQGVTVSGLPKLVALLAILEKVSGQSPLTLSLLSAIMAPSLKTASSTIRIVGKYLRQACPAHSTIVRA